MSIQSFHGFACHPAASWCEISQSGTSVTIRASPKTDWWRVPPPESVESRTGAFLAHTIDATRDFQVGVWIRGEWNVQFDQGCLMLLAGDSDDLKGNWVKTGVELESGKEYIGAVVTSAWSDWSIAPSTHTTSTSASSHAYALYMSIVRKGPLLTIKQHLAPQPSHMPPDESEQVMIREVRGFHVDNDGQPLAKEGDKWRVGVMVCGPMNERGTTAEFRNFVFQYL